MHTRKTSKDMGCINKSINLMVAFAKITLVYKVTNSFVFNDLI